MLESVLFVNVSVEARIWFCFAMKSVLVQMLISTPLSNLWRSCKGAHAAVATQRCCLLTCIITYAHDLALASFSIHKLLTSTGQTRLGHFTITGSSICGILMTPERATLPGKRGYTLRLQLLLVHADLSSAAAASRHTVYLQQQNGTANT